MISLDLLDALDVLDMLEGVFKENDDIIEDADRDQVRALLLGPLPKVPSASLVSVPNPHLCASSVVLSCASSEQYLFCLLVRT